LRTDLVFSLFAFSALTLAFQRFTFKHRLQVVGLTMRSATCNQFPIKNFNDLLKFFTCVVISYLNADMCWFESSKKDESRAHSADSSKPLANLELVWQ